jgi:hypothetical protein
MAGSCRLLVVVTVLFLASFGLPGAGLVQQAAAQITVSSADPPSGAQGTYSLDVTIKGKGFKSGAKAAFYKTGTADPAGVSVRSTRYVNSTALVATVDIADEADLSKFDIEVANADGRTGKGTELFAVTAKVSIVELNAGFLDFTSLGLPAKIRNDRPEPYISQKVSGWANWAYLTTAGTLMLQAVYPGALRYVLFQFDEPYGSSAYYPAGAYVSCQAVDGVGPLFSYPVPEFLLDTSSVHVPDPQPTYFRTSNGKEWVYDGSVWVNTGSALNLLTMGDQPRYMGIVIEFYTDALHAQNAAAVIAYNNPTGGPNVIGYTQSLVKVTRSGDTWTITPVPAGDGGIADANIGNVTLNVPTPRKRSYTSNYGTCNLGSFVMPFELTLTRR